MEFQGNTWSKKVFIVTATILFLAILGQSAASASEITGGLKDTIDQVMKIVTDENLKNDQTILRERLRDTIGKRFSFQQMGRRSLAKDWTNRTSEEKEEFIQLFKKILEKSYASKIESFRNGKIEYFEEKVKGKYALVKTKILRQSETVNIDYKLIREKDEWLVYDFVVKGVSMVRNYNSQFSKIISEQSFDSLLKKMTHIAEKRI